MVVRLDLMVLRSVTNGGGRVPGGGVTDVVGRAEAAAGWFSF